ncbi:unnamed protein product, partial [Discosporangium mesarthrocarpum]
MTIPRLGRVIVDGAMAENCMGDGVTQYMFRKMGVKHRSNRDSAKDGGYRLEGRAFSRIFSQTPGLCGPNFMQADCDLIFARAKNKEEKTVTYSQFMMGVHIIAATLFPEVKSFREFSNFRGKASRLLELVYARILQASWAAEFRTFSCKAGDRYVFNSATKVQKMARGKFGRKRFARAFAEREAAEVLGRKCQAATKIQALERRYLSRCRAVSLAKIILQKYVDPISGQPFWHNPRTGTTSWIKPSILGLSDLDAATMVPTSKTEHLVLCSNCEEKPAARVCQSCRDSYCGECFSALHGKGNRQFHLAPLIPLCCVCGYQQGTRLCETCTTKQSKTCAYCDVCFFNSHPTLVPLVSSETAVQEAMAGNQHKRPNRGDHRWTPLVVMCVECTRYAARWLCDDCEEVYCSTCYSSVHSHGSKVS